MSNINAEIVKLLQSKIYVAHGELASTPQDIVGLEEAATVILDTVIKSILAREKSLLEGIANGEDPKSKLEDVTTAFNEYCQEHTNAELLANIFNLFQDFKHGNLPQEEFISQMDAMVVINPETNDVAPVETPVELPAEAPADNVEPETQYQQLVSANGYDAFSFAFKYEDKDVEVSAQKVKDFVENDGFLSFCYKRLEESDELEKVKTIYNMYIKGVESYQAKLI